MSFDSKNHLKREMLTPKSSSEPWYCHGDWVGGKAALCHEVGSGSVSGESAYKYNEDLGRWAVLGCAVALEVKRPRC